MNLSITISFIIGGLMMISIILFINQVFNQRQELTLNNNNNIILDNLVELIEDDFNKIGFKALDAIPFSTTNSQKIIFQADLYNNDNYGSTNIEWFFDTTDPVESTSNPNDFYLKRTGPVDVDKYETIKFPVVHFEINYFTANGIETTDKSIIKKIEVEVIIETPEPYTINTQKKEYPHLIWKKQFIPSNINVPY